MLFFVTALSAEAKPIVQKYNLKRIYTLPYTLFENDEIKLLVTGIGLQNAMLAVSAFLGHYTVAKTDILINIGICAAPKIFAIGQTLLIHKLTCNMRFGHKEHAYYPDILFEHPFHESELLSLEAPKNAHHPFPVDMEAYGIYTAAARFLDAHRMLFFKIVSDHFEPETVNKEQTTILIETALPNILQAIQNALCIFTGKTIFAQEEKNLIEQISLLLTKSQSDAFYDACRYYKLHRKKSFHESGIQIPKHKLTKQQRSAYFDKLIAALTH
jgi:adenosylhomocysteine nucleosidase